MEKDKENSLANLTSGALREIPLSLQDIEELKVEIQKLRKGAVSEDDFKKYRLQRGVYGQKQKPDIQMVRVKIPWGRLNSTQLEALADVADTYPGEDRGGISHVTTRQDIQFHFIKLDQIPECLNRLAKVGLTTREACANTVRNVTADPLAGVARDEVFDISPYAEAVARFCLRHPVCQNMARKFKIAFSGSSEDRGLIPMHDLGALAEIRNVNGQSVRGFKVFVGGGLGASPKSAQLLEEFTPETELLKTVHAVLFVYNRDWDYGRKFRNMARIKFFLEKIGLEEFRKRVFLERENFKAIEYPKIEIFEEKAPLPFAGPYLTESKDASYLRWKSTNVIAQKQKGYNVLTLRLPLGDILSKGLRALAHLVNQYGNGFVRTTVQQNIVVGWIKDELVYSFYCGLKEAGLSLPSAERLADITVCPGADTCQLGITSSRGLATAIGKIFMNGHSEDADLKDIKIKISGCPNSCGQHHIADIGFYGGSKSISGHQVPTYTMMLGGFIGPEGHSYGHHFLRVPSKKAPAVVERLLDIYKERKLENEKFRQFVARVGLKALQAELEPLTVIGETPDKEFFADWGGEGEFQVVIGKGECAA